MRKNCWSLQAVTELDVLDVTAFGRRLFNEELNDPYSSPNIIQVIKSGRVRNVGHLTGMGARRGPYRTLVGKLEWKRPLWKPSFDGRAVWKQIFQEVGMQDIDWINLAQDRDRRRAVVKAVMNLRVGYIKYGEFLCQFSVLLPTLEGLCSMTLVHDGQ